MEIETVDEEWIYRQHIADDEILLNVQKYLVALTYFLEKKHKGNELNLIRAFRQVIEQADILTNP